MHAHAVETLLGNYAHRLSASISREKEFELRLGHLLVGRSQDKTVEKPLGHCGTNSSSATIHSASRSHSKFLSVPVKSVGWQARAWAARRVGV
jgi:hypothetical protein